MSQARVAARPRRLVPFARVDARADLAGVRSLAFAGLLAGLLAALFAACSGPAATPRITPGTSDRPREVVILAKDYLFVPPVVDLAPGETVVLRVVNGGLVVHEAVLGPMPVQLVWEAAEGATATAPPGPTPLVSVPPGLEGVRVVVGSGERRDVTWTVPADAASVGWLVGCHIPGHWAQGMAVPVRWVGADGRPIPGAPTGAAPTPTGP